ncbi:MAG: methyltransferase, TIGR04325 family [Paracoccaceae bacterium]
MSSVKSAISTTRRQMSHLSLATKTRLRMATGRKPRFTGAFPDREAALASLPPHARQAYDQDVVVDVSRERMQRVEPWDYPVLYWMQRCLGEGRLSLLDAGGHVGTKFTAFSEHLPMNRLDWNVWDLPAILRAGRAGQAEGTVPAALRFVDTPAAPGPVDLLLASGLLQFFDRPLAQLIAEMAELPAWIILNKVAVRDGDTVVTLEQVGPAQIPYQIRGEADWLSELESLPYRLVDSWDNPTLRHRIGTHPWLGESRSKGYVLQRR